MTAYITTSWDDGHQFDRRMADELAACGIAGTFYIAPRCRELDESSRLADADVRTLSQGFEIGGHTLTHPHLTRIPDGEAWREIADGKTALESVVGRELTAFCYPYGDFGALHPEMVERAGYSVGRTIERFRTDAPSDWLRMGASVHASNYLTGGAQVLRRSRSLRHAAGMWRNWDVLGRRLLEDAVADGGVFHLWGHSWEIEAHDDWGRLRQILRELAGADAVCVTNGELVTRLAGVA